MTAPTLLRLRKYQQDCIDAINESLKTNTRVAAVLSTGAGKTVIFSHLAEQAHREGRKTLILVHREELAEQAKTKLHSVAPHLSVGLVKAARNEVDADVIVASVQTLSNLARRKAIKDIGIVIVDECHHAVARTWMEVLEHFGCFDSTPAVGFTATLTRTDGKGLGDVWEEVAYEKDILWMIDNGYLTDVRGISVTVDGLDLATVARSRGDYQDGQLGEAMMASGAAEVVASAYVEHAKDRRGILFAPTVASAYDFAEGLNSVGIATETITGVMPRDERAQVYSRFERGDTQVLSSVGVLTEGFDAPWAEVCVMARPTTSPVLFTQAVGRVIRPWPGKDEALVLDVVGIAGSHKLQSLTNLVKTTVQEGESYAEARERIEKEAREVGERSKLTGAIKAQQVELFANSHSTWLMTHGGKWFIPTTYGLFFLWPALTDEGDTVGTWRLGYKAQKRGGPRVIGPKGNGDWIEKNLTLEYAMTWGETMAELDDPTVSLKDRAWRRTKASAAQQDLAIRMKVAPAEHILELRKGPLSDLISIHVASRMLDI